MQPLIRRSWAAAACAAVLWAAAVADEPKATPKPADPPKADAAKHADAAKADAAKHADAAKADPTKLVHVQEGNLPIIISAPHGGRAEVPGVPERKGEGIPRGATGFVAGVDVNTDKLALAVAALIEEKTERKPYVCVARFARRYIDANRPPEIAYEHPNAKPVYEHYHGTMDKFCAAVQKRYGRGVVFDFHGQASDRTMIFRGTQNGSTVKLLTERFGEKAHKGPESFFGLLAKNGCKVFPEVGSDDAERKGFSGGFITRTYGSQGGHGIDAMQLEFGADYTDADKIKVTAPRVTEAILAYRKHYLPLKPVEGSQ